MDKKIKNQNKEDDIIQRIKFTLNLNFKYFEWFLFGIFKSTWLDGWLFLDKWRALQIN